MRKKIGIAAHNMVLSLLIAATIVHAEPVLNETMKYYDVKGSHQAEIDNYMLTYGPIAWNNRIVYGMMSPRFSWRDVRSGVDADWCMITGITVVLDVTYTMPQWNGYSSTSSDLQRKWDFFFDRLLRHEKSHAGQALDAARAIEREALQVRTRSCQEARERLWDIQERNIALFRQAADGFDKRDTHVFGLEK